MSVTTDTHERLYFCIDNLINQIPPEMQNHPMAKIMSTMARESRKDIRRLPEEYIIAVARTIGEAFAWVADGSMEDVTGTPDASH